MEQHKVILNVTVTIVLITAEFACSTINPKYSQRGNTTELHDRWLLDRDGNKYPVKILKDIKLWMTLNLKLNISNSYCYDDATRNCDQYGRLYTWEAAQKGCALLGEGWRLPITYDWQQLTILYAGAAKDSDAMRQGAFQALLYTGASGFNALLGGGRAPDSQYARLDAHGFYWMATENNDSTAWFANFAKGSQSLYLQKEGEKSRAFSVRCVKDIDSSK